jgi:RNA polymerase sigma-70 factor (ECF subfamily)
MSDEQSFADLIRRVRAGDDQAATELVRRYEPAIRLAVRMHLNDPNLYRLFDSMDICQSVLASFFVRAAAGHYELNNPQQLLRLLVGIARNKVAFQARKQRAQRRDHRRRSALPLEKLEIAAADASPSQLIAGQDLLREFRQRLTEEERRLADLRAEGHDWAAIAAEVGGTPQARRMQLARAVKRVSRELGLDEVEGE